MRAIHYIVVYDTIGYLSSPGLSFEFITNICNPSRRFFFSIPVDCVYAHEGGVYNPAFMRIKKRQFMPAAAFRDFVLLYPVYSAAWASPS